MCVGVSFNNASGYGINHNLTPLDILAGGDLWVVWQSPGYGGGEKGGGSKEGVTTDTRTSEHDQVPLGCPLCSGHLNIGVDCCKWYLSQLQTCNFSIT